MQQPKAKQALAFEGMRKAAWVAHTGVGSYVIDQGATPLPLAITGGVTRYMYHVSFEGRPLGGASSFADAVKMAEDHYSGA